MPHTITMPMLGETMIEATVERWLKNEGDGVNKGDVLLEITTDKATLEVESTDTGTLRKILALEGSTVAVNEPIAVLAGEGEEVPKELLEYRPKTAEELGLRAGARDVKPSPAGTAKVPARETRRVTEPSVELQAAGAVQPAVALAGEPVPYAVPDAFRGTGGRVFISPRARATARRLDLAWKHIPGTGPNGRIAERDVLEYADAAGQFKVTPAARRLAVLHDVDLRKVRGTGPGGRIKRADVESAIEGTPEQLSAMRRIVGERMGWSARNVPQFSVTASIDVTRSVEMRKAREEKGKRISFADIIIRACALAMEDFRWMTALLHEGRVLLRKNINIGLAVGLDEGLVVPVIRNANEKSLDEIANETVDLAARARTKKLTPDEYSGGLFTVSNLGMLDVGSFTAIVNPGESGILAVARAREIPIREGDSIAWKPMMPVSLSCDHRIVDGLYGAKFLMEVKRRIEMLDLQGPDRLEDPGRQENQERE